MKVGILLALVSFNLFAHQVGQRTYVLEDAARARKLATTIWYPADASVKTKVLERGPFTPVEVAVDAPVVKGQTWPVVLLSHGSGGKADKLFWIASHLVKNGFLVIAVDHPGNMTGDNTAEGVIRIWERARDLSFALDRTVESSEFRFALDLNRVSALGHSAGGTTALLLGGAKFSAARFGSPFPNCAGTKDPYYAKLCEGVGKIDFKKYDPKLVEGDYSDKRVKAVVGFDPGYAKALDVKGMTARPLVFVADKLTAPQDEIYSKQFLKLFPNASLVVPGSLHMTFIAACKPKFPKDDPELRELCAENDKKLALQTESAELTLKFLSM